LKICSKFPVSFFLFLNYFNSVEYWKFRANFQCFMSKKQKHFCKKKIVFNFYSSSPTTVLIFNMHFETCIPRYLFNYLLFFYYLLLFSSLLFLCFYKSYFFFTLKLLVLIDLLYSVFFDTYLLFFIQFNILYLFLFFFLFSLLVFI
jgi:hypothetical protein